MCDATCSESGQLLTIKPCGWYLALQSDRDRLAGVVTGMEEQGQRNIDALRRAERRAIERESDNAMRITALRKQRDNMEKENARLRELLSPDHLSSDWLEHVAFELVSNGYGLSAAAQLRKIKSALKEVG